uniref:Uncharacterized protein n=1 Tax=Mustela putorius furo TaxID=9669 RepID=M3Y4W3_MUSPF
MAGQEHPTSGCSTRRSCPRRIRGARELSRGPGVGFLAQAAGPERGLTPRPRHCPRAGGAVSSPLRARHDLDARARTWQNVLSRSPRWARQRWTWACKPGDGKVASELEWSSED